MKEQQVVNRLVELNYTIASAESCTGGLFAGTIINVPCASKVINSSIVTYSNEAKQKYCGVKAQTIEKFGVVSEQVAIEMAVGIARECGANVGVSFSGVAGPGGGTKETPVGTVCMAFAINGKVESFTKVFDGNRMEVRQKCVEFALEKLLEILQ